MVEGRRAGRSPRARASDCWLRVFRLLAWLSQPKYTLGAMVYVRRSNGDVLLVRQRLRTPSLWGLPGGFKKPRETAAQAASRELREEVGLDLRIGTADCVAQYEQPWARHLDTVFCVSADDTTGGRLSRRSIEIVEARWFPPDTLPPLTREADLALRHLPG